MRQQKSTSQSGRFVSQIPYPRVLRARLRLEVEHDAEGAAEDAQTALDFYREHDVDSRWSREAEEILENIRAPDAS